MRHRLPSPAADQQADRDGETHKLIYHCADLSWCGRELNQSFIKRSQQNLLIGRVEKIYG